MKKIKTQLTVIILLTSCLSVAFVAILLGYFSIKNSRIGFKRELSITANLISENVSGALAFGDIGRVQEILSALHQNQAIQSACIYDDSNVLISSFSSLHKQENCAQTLMQGPLQSSKTSSTLIKEIRQKDTLLGYIYISADMGPLETGIRYQILFVVLVLGAVLFTVALPLANTLQKSISEPLTDFIKETKRISSGDLQIYGENQDKENEILFLRSMAQNLIPFYKGLALDLRNAKDSNVFLLSNKYLVQRYFEHKIKVSHLSNRLIKNSIEQEVLGQADRNYVGVVKKNEEISEGVEKEFVALWDLLHTEGKTVGNLKQQVELYELINQAFGEVFGADPFISFHVLSHHGSQVWPVHKEAFYLLVVHIFRAFSVFKYEGGAYLVNVFVDSMSDLEGDKCMITFELKPEYNCLTKELYLNKEAVDQCMFNIKFFYNINNPGNPRSLGVDFKDHEVIFTVFLPVY